MTRIVLELPDHGWTLWLDRAAEWQNDVLYLPHEVRINDLPVNPPSGGWSMLDDPSQLTFSKSVTLPTTVEEHNWDEGALGRLTSSEYFFAVADPLFQDGIYRGVSWWWLDFDAGDLSLSKHVELRVPAARLRAEIFLNNKLVAYDLIGETPFVADVGAALMAGRNRIAIRLTNPGGRYDWVDFHRASDGADPGLSFEVPALKWGDYVFPASHGFGGLDCGLKLTATDDIKIDDVFIRNTPQVSDVFAEITILNRRKASELVDLSLVILRCGDGMEVWRRDVSGVPLASGSTSLSFPASVADATPWSPETPQLYEFAVDLRGGDGTDRVAQKFGFRWFTATGLGGKACWRLNGRRLRIRSAISWNWWALNGLFPTNELVDREVEAAKSLGLNTLTCHRNIGNARSLDATDAGGILRWEEPGAGRSAWVGSEFEKSYAREKIHRMVMRDRNHPSLVIIGLQNEQVQEHPLHAELKATMDLVKELDPTRTVVLKSGFASDRQDLTDVPERMRKYANKQAFYLPGDDLYHHDDVTGWAGWWDAHTVGGPGIYQDWIYRNPCDFSHGSTKEDQIVYWGEALGSGSADNLGKIRRYFEANKSQAAFHKAFHLQLATAYDDFLDNEGFREAFPSVDDLTNAIADRSYYYWGRIVENARISDAVDGMAISGWESGVIDQHCGLVDVFRNLKGDGRLLKRYTSPLHVAIKTRGLLYSLGQAPVVDVHIVNETGEPIRGRLNIWLKAPSSAETHHLDVGDKLVELQGGDHYAELVAEGVRLPELTCPGEYEIVARFHSDDLIVEGREGVLCVAVSGLSHPAVWAIEADAALVSALADLGIATSASPYATSKREVAVIGASGDSHQTIPREVLEFVRSGGSAVLLADGRGVGSRWARQLAEAGVGRIDDFVGPALSSWSGSWYIVKNHPLFEGLPVNTVMSWQYQADPRGRGAWFDSNSLEHFGDGVIWSRDAPTKTLVAYGRDHNPKFGAAVSEITYGKGRIVLSMLAGLYSSLAGEFAGFSPLVARKILSNAVRYLGEMQ